jgi:hypothetical protein
VGDADPTKGVPWIHFLICLGGKKKITHWTGLAIDRDDKDEAFIWE